MDRELKTNDIYSLGGKEGFVYWKTYSKGIPLLDRERWHLFLGFENVKTEKGNNQLRAYLSSINANQIEVKGHDVTTKDGTYFEARPNKKTLNEWLKTINPSKTKGGNK